MLMNQDVLAVLPNLYINITNVYGCKQGMRQHKAVWLFTSKDQTAKARSSV